MLKNKKKVLFTGGHAGTCALALVEEIKKRHLNWEIYWMGSKYLMEGKFYISPEMEYLRKAGVNTISVVSGKLNRKFDLLFIISIFKLPINFIHSLYHMIKIKPDLIFSFGSFTSFWVILIGKFLGIPVIIHEQTVVCGRANRLGQIFADKILLARYESQKYFRKNKTEVVGNPILSNFFDTGSRKNNVEIKTILIMGGSRGSQIINSLIKNNLNSYLEKFRLIHITGSVNFKEFEITKHKLDSSSKENYLVYSYVNPHKMADLYKKSDLVIGRAGASSVSELIASNTPSIFIPIPWSYLNEQYKNAEYASKFIPTVILNQDEISPGELYEEVLGLLNSEKNIGFIKSPDVNASEKIIDSIISILK